MRVEFPAVAQAEILVLARDEPLALGRGRVSGRGSGRTLGFGSGRVSGVLGFVTPGGSLGPTFNGGFFDGGGSGLFGISPGLNGPLSGRVISGVFGPVTGGLVIVGGRSMDGRVPPGSVTPGSVPVGSLPIGSLPIGSLPIGSLVVGSLPIGSRPIGPRPGSLPIGLTPIAGSVVRGPTSFPPVACTNGCKLSVLCVGEITAGPTPIGPFAPPIPLGVSSLARSVEIWRNVAAWAV